MTLLWHIYKFQQKEMFFMSKTEFLVSGRGQTYQWFSLFFTHLHIKDLDSNPCQRRFFSVFFSSL